MGIFNNTNRPFQIFGSANSIDLDVCFFVDEIGKIETSKRTLKQLVNKQFFKESKKVNGNLAVVKKGKVTACFKGEVAELNNSLYSTYKLHLQVYPSLIKHTLPRSVYAKIKRCNRTLLGLFTRTNLRKEVKMQLKNEGLLDQLMFIEQLNLQNFTDFGKNGSPIEVYKSMAFQIGQCLGLFNGNEFYTKNDLARHYPDLAVYLNREKASSKKLNDFKNHYVNEAISYLKKSAAL